MGHAQKTWGSQGSVEPSTMAAEEPLGTLATPPPPEEESEGATDTESGSQGSGAEVTLAPVTRTCRAARCAPGGIPILCIISELPSLHCLLGLEWERPPARPPAVAGATGRTV